MGYSPWGCKELDTTEELHSLTLNEGGDCVAYIHYQISNNGELDISANINIKQGGERALRENSIFYSSFLAYGKPYFLILLQVGKAL